MGYFGIPFRNGVPIGLGSIVGFGAPQEFSPSELFLGGTAGAWYDPSDLSTMFDTSAGTTPVAMPGQGSAVSVGLMLDKSQGLVLGSETVTNGDFSGGTTTGWTATNAALSVVGGQLSVVPSTTFGYAYQTLTTVVGTTYRLTFSFDQSTAATARYFVGTSVGDGSIIGLTTVSGVGSVSRYFTATTTTTFIHFGAQNSSGLQVLFDNISVRAIAGNHAIAINDTTARPELRARVNLLTYSEDLTNAAWVKQSGTSVNATPVADPNGALTAWLVTGNGTSGIYQAAAGSVSLGQSVRSVYLRTQSGTATVGIKDPAVTQGTTTCNVTTTWQRFTLTETTTPTGGFVGGIWVFNIPASGVEIAWPDFRPANIGANVPAYQRIADANTYDTNGFPLYLFFNGLDDGMYTPANLNLSATDKVGVFAGVRKLSDADSIIAELSNNFNNVIGGLIVNYVATGVKTAAALKGNIGYSSGEFTDSAAPVSEVLSTLMDMGLSTNEISFINKNGVAQTLTRTNNNNNTVNFGTYPLNIGVRSATSSPTLYFNGHLHGLIIAGSAVSAGNISATESWMAGKTGLVLP